MAGVVILTPVLRRPHRVAPLLDSIERATPEAHVLFLCDPDDTAEQEAIVAARRGRRLRIEMQAPGGNYAHKINEGVRLSTEPLIFMGADDLEYHPGWFAAACGLLDRASVIGTNDLCSPRVRRGDHATHSMLTREYAGRGTIDNPEWVLHEHYPHEYVDDEFVGTARYRGEFAFCAAAVVEHLHPDVGKAPTDELYDARPVRMRKGLRIYRRRRKLWT